MTSLATSGGATSANPGALYYSLRQFKDFELSVDYRTAATNNNGGVFLRFPAPATVADIDRGGYQVAILDNGAATTRTGAITQERGPVTSFAAPTAPSTLYKPTREWNTLTIRAVRSHIQVWINGVLTSTYDAATRNGRAGYIGLENAGNNLMYRSVRIKELAPDTVAPTVTVDVPATLALGTARPAELQLRRRVRARELRRHARRPAGRQRRAAQRDPRPAHAGRDRDRRRGPRDDADDRVQRRRAGHRLAERHGAATLALTLGAPPSFGAFTPGVPKTYTAQTTATITSTAGDATLSVSDPDTVAPMRLQQRHVHAGAAADHEPAEDVGGPGLQRRRARSRSARRSAPTSRCGRARTRRR